MSDPKLIDDILHCQKRIKKDGVSEDKLLHYLGRLSRLEITVQALSDTGIGRTVNSLSRNDGNIGQAAETLVRRWKLMVEEQQQKKPESEEEESDSSSESEAGSGTDESVTNATIDDDNDNEEYVPIVQSQSNGFDSLEEESHRYRNCSPEPPQNERNQFDRKNHSMTSNQSSKRFEDNSNTILSSKNSKHNNVAATAKKPLKTNDDDTFADSSKSRKVKKEDTNSTVSSRKSSKSIIKDDEDSKSASFGAALECLDKRKSRKNEKELDERKTPQMQIESTLKPVAHNSQLNYLDNNDSPSDNDNDAISNMLSNRNRNARSKVFSGVKLGRGGAVPTLFDICMQFIKENIANLTYTGGISYDILKPALERATPQQLIEIETLNDYLVGETDELWQFHCRRDFRGECPGEIESWRDLYERCKDGQQRRFEQIRNKMKRQLETAEPARKAKLAYVESGSSAPKFNREKAQTIKNGMKTLKTKEEKGAKRGVASSASAGFNNPKVSADPNTVVLEEASVIISKESRARHSPAPSISRERGGGGESVAKQKPKRAPLMQKTMKLIRSLNRR